MKKLLLMSLGIGFYLSSAYASQITNSSTPFSQSRDFANQEEIEKPCCCCCDYPLIVSLYHANQEFLESFFNGNHPELTLECPEGGAFPFNFSLRGNFLALNPLTNQPPYIITVSKTFFIKCVNQDLMFSSDLETWKTFNDFFTGEIGVSVHPTGTVPQISLELELNLHH